MRTGSGRCLIFAMQMASDYLARLTRAARRVQGPRSGTFRKLDTEATAYHPRTPHEASGRRPSNGRQVRNGAIVNPAISGGASLRD